MPGEKATWKRKCVYLWNVYLDLLAASVMAVNQSLVASVRLRRILSSPCNTYRINLLQISQISQRKYIGLLPFLNPSNRAEIIRF
jgi:hypothetical protein